MGGVEYAVPIGIAILLYFLFPAYLKNRQRRLVEGMREKFQNDVIRSAEATLVGQWLRFPASLVLTPDYLIIQNVWSLYADEIPLERLRNLGLQYKSPPKIPHPEDDSPSGNVLIITTTEQSYRIIFNDADQALDWKSAIETTI